MATAEAQILTFPSNRDAERMVLGAIFVSNELAPHVLPVLGPDDFVNVTYRAIFRAMRTLDAKREDINPLTLSAQIAKQGDDVPLATLGELMDGVPRFSAPASVQSYVRQIQAASLRRQVMHLGEWATASAQSVDVEPGELVEQLVGRLDGMRTMHQSANDLIPSDEAVRRTLDLLQEQWNSHGVIGIPTGFADLDRHLLGLRGGRMYVIAAGPNIGKTTLGLNIVDRMMQHGHRIGQPYAGLIISMEMPVDQLTVKLLGVRTRIDTQRMESGKLDREETKAILQAAEDLSNVHLEYLEGFAKVTPATLAARVERVKARHGRIDFLLVDYLQLIDADAGAKATEYQAISEVSRRLKQIAVQYNIPVIAISQLNRQHASRTNKDYQLSDLRGSGSIEQDADVVLFLMPTDWMDEHNPARRLRIAKHRAGKKDVECPLVFFGSQSRFETANYE